MSESTTTDAAAAAARKSPTPTWVLATVCGLFGLVYAYAVWNALGNLIQSAQQLQLNGLGWFVWIFATLFPILVFAGAFALGYRRPVGHLVVILLTGLALVAVFWLNVVAYTTLNTSALIVLPAS